MDNKIYANFITTKVSDIAQQDLEHQLSWYLWQDDNDTKHRTAHVLSEVSTVFPNRIDIKRQAAKMADIWPIENVWGILYEKLRLVEFSSLDEMERRVGKVWRDIDKNLCSKMIVSIPKRLRAVITKNGDQIAKEDY